MNPSILIVDDEKIILQTLQVIFEREGIAVDIEPNPLRAIERYREHDYSIMLLDIIMPEMKGTEVLRAVKQINPLVNVIMMTAFSTMTYVIECIENGAVDYVTKPLTDMDLIIQIVRDANNRVDRWKKSFGLLATLD